jgi:hypothetical protein
MGVGGRRINEDTRMTTDAPVFTWFHCSFFQSTKHNGGRCMCTNREYFAPSSLCSSLTLSLAAPRAIESFMRCIVYKIQKFMFIEMLPYHDFVHSCVRKQSLRFFPEIDLSCI